MRLKILKIRYVFNLGKRIHIELFIKSCTIETAKGILDFQ